MDLKATFEKYEDEHGNFERVDSPPCTRPDLCALLLLAVLQPGKRDIISAAEHDEIWLDVNVDELAKVVSEEEVLMLVRCGVRYDSSLDSLGMYV